MKVRNDHRRVIYMSLSANTITANIYLKMTSAQVVETSVTNNSFFQNYPYLDDHTIRITDTPGFKPFTIE